MKELKMMNSTLEKQNAELKEIKMEVKNASKCCEKSEKQEVQKDEEKEEDVIIEIGGGKKKKEKGILEEFEPLKRLGICSAYGDPHITSFDGFGHYYNQQPRTLWMVKSPKLWVQIQTRQGGPVKKIAVRTVSNVFVMDFHQFEGGGKRERINPRIFMNTKSWGFKADRHVDQEIVAAERELRLAGRRWNNANFFRNRPTYSLVLPDNVKISYATHTPESLALMVKMPPQDGMTGWCGDFDGNPGNDDTMGNARVNNPESAVSRNEDLFMRGPNLLQESGKEYSDLPPMSDPMQKSVPVAAMQVHQDGDGHEVKKGDHLKVRCSHDLLHKARHACKAIPERETRKSCIFDVCFMKDVKVAEGEYELEAMEVLEGKGVPVFVDSGWCLDVQGRRYSSQSVTGDKVATWEGCEWAVEQAASADDLKGIIRGAQLRTDTNPPRCEFIYDKDAGQDMKDTHKNDWSFNWGNDASEHDGQAIVSRASGDVGKTCWRVY